MARLGNAKHEQFAQAIANGTYPTQEAAYVACGYKEANAKSHASHLAKRPDVKARIEELQAKTLAPVIGGGTELAEACPWLTVTWLAAQYDLIRQKAMAAGDMKAASATVKNVQSLIDLETKLAAEQPAQPAAAGRIDVTTIFDKLENIVTAAKTPVGQLAVAFTR